MFPIGVLSTQVVFNDTQRLFLWCALAFFLLLVALGHKNYRPKI